MRQLEHMKSIFARNRIPEELVSDNMPYNSWEFKDIASSQGFKLTTSSPTYAQSNGLSEWAVQTVRNMLKKAHNPYIGLCEYRNTPVTGSEWHTHPPNFSWAAEQGQRFQQQGSCCSPACQPMFANNYNHAKGSKHRATTKEQGSCHP